MFDNAIAYYQDDLTWCIQRAHYFPLSFSFFFIAPPCYWFLLFAVGYTSGTFLYILIQFDTKDKHRNKRDWHYTCMLIVFPSALGMNQNYNPYHQMIRYFHVQFSALLLLLWPVLFLNILKFIKEPVQHWQITTVAELVDNKFRLSGSSEVQSLITFDERVFYFFITLLNYF